MIDCNLQHIKENTLNSLSDSGLGNMLFQIATCYALSKQYYVKWQINDIIIVKKLLSSFGGNHEETIYRKIEGGKKVDSVYIEENRNIYDEKFLKKVRGNIKNNITINGYFQSYKYFDFCKEDILNLFEMDPRSRDIIKKKYPILFTNKETVSLHIRNAWSSAIKYSEDYFKEAINSIKKKGPITYLIFSDSPVNFPFLKDLDTIFVKDNLDYIDLWAMSLCKNNIVSHSTLSWWGAYLNKNPKKTVIYSSDWVQTIYRKKTKEFKRDFPPSHYPPDWIDLKIKLFI